MVARARLEKQQANAERTNEKRREKKRQIVTFTTEHAALRRQRAREEPPWAALAETLGKINDRLEKLEQRPAPAPIQLAAPVNGAAKKPIIIRCDGCGSPYEGQRMPVGSMNLCSECAKPGSWMTRCVSCGNAFYTTEPKQIEVKDGRKKKKVPNELKCRTCTKCCLCGTKEDDKVCAQCVKDGARVCEFCARLAMAGGYCIQHAQVPTALTAGHFDETAATPPPNLRPDMGGVTILGASAPVTGGIYLGGGQ